MVTERKLRLKVELPPVFRCTFSANDRAIVLSWTFDTEVSNLIWVRILVFKLAWPPIRYYQGFTNKPPGGN